MKKGIVFLIFISSLLAKAQLSTSVYYVDISDDKTISENPIQKYTPKSSKNSGKKITVYPDIQFQTLEGIGGAFNEIGGEALFSLPNRMQNKLMQNLFSKNDGSGFSFCRTAIGASDFGIDAYSYSEVEGDYKMENFSFKREKEAVLPYIQKAHKFNKNLRIFASPWSPPGWMKGSGYMDRGVEFPEKNHLKDNPEVYAAYALYFLKYVKNYAKNGVVIDRIIIQNEPDVHTKYPSCVMPPEQMAHFSKEYLRPTFQKNKVKTGVWAGTFRTAQQLDAIEFVADKKMRNSVDGIGIQYTKTRYINDMQSLFPGVNMMHTEGKCFNGKNSMEQARTRLSEVAGYINHGSPNYCYWNMILNETGKSGWDWKQNSLININRDEKTITYNPDYAVIYLMSKFLQPGAKRIASFCRSDIISVENNGEIYLLVQNEKNEVEYFECHVAGEKTVVEVPANSLSAIVVNKK
ncbi:glycoside hydrolase family 30 protein [Flavivirga rizhaonensis]|uniref:Glycosyl hydrolase family 30 TIM-barrel domain-containing protein n=1 Tax=Flavivirga rizhaonensis TaxID=2559571 RepID=A0A4S1E2G7_9FLAO|nr:hypothetical protein [Flavivirga rizhaonensis]TGV04168.1 hypothetical protein EM932_03250 [Flavivirga rizhaonensis]